MLEPQELSFLKPLCCWLREAADQGSIYAQATKGCHYPVQASKACSSAAADRICGGSWGKAQCTRPKLHWSQTLSQDALERTCCCPVQALETGGPPAAARVCGGSW